MTPLGESKAEIASKVSDDPKNPNMKTIMGHLPKNAVDDDFVVRPFTDTSSPVACPVASPVASPGFQLQCIVASPGRCSDRFT